MKLSIRKNILIPMTLGAFSLLQPSCKHDYRHAVKNDNTIPTLQELDSVQRSNTVGNKIQIEKNPFDNIANYKIIGFGHYHEKITNFSAFRLLIPKFRQAGYSALALELPANIQFTLLDSIMDMKTTPENTKRLLNDLNKYLVDGEVFTKESIAPNTRHHLFDIILDWLNSGGVVLAVDVPYVYNPIKRRNDYDTDLMFKTIKERSQDLFENVKDIDINELDDKKDLAKIASVRSAYMSCMLDYYVSQNVKIVSFLGLKHVLLSGNSDGIIPVSIVPISNKYFNTRVFTFYPYFTDNQKGFFEGHKWIGNVAYSVPTSK